MTLIPLMSAIVATPRSAAASAGGARLARDSYNPGAAHRPVAAMLAFGFPAALVVAVALSPMIIPDKPRVASEPWESFIVETQKPETPPDPKPQTDPVQTEFTAPPTPLPKVSDDSTRAAPQPPYRPPAGTGSGPEILDPPAPPPKPAFVLAQLDPRYAGSFQPDYPASEQRREVEGVAKVKILIGIDGRVKAVELISTDSPGFFEETKRRALAKWRFKPATRGGTPEESWKVMTVRFEIKNG